MQEFYPDPYEAADSALDPASSDFVTALLVSIASETIVAILSAAFSMILTWLIFKRVLRRRFDQIIVNIYVYILQHAQIAMFSASGNVTAIERLVGAIKSQLGPVLSFSGELSGYVKSLEDALAGKEPQKPSESPPKVEKPSLELEKAKVIAPGHPFGVCGVQDGYIVKEGKAPSPPDELEIISRRNARIRAAVERFYNYWCQREARINQMRDIQIRFTEARTLVGPIDVMKQELERQNEKKDGEDREKGDKAE